MRRFFHHDKPEERAAADECRDRAARGEALLEAGGLPLNAQERLSRQSAAGAHGARLPWSSNLGVGEFLTTRALQFEVLGQVLGTSIYHVAYNVMQSQQYGDSELATYSRALYDARDRALGRLRQEAALLGAHGVVGVRLEQKGYEWGEHLIDIAAVGTAVRLPDAPPLERPFLSVLSGQETWELLQAGYTPVGVALGCCCYYVMTTWDDEWRKRNWSNGEMVHYTAGIYAARHGATGRMAAEGQAMGADGIVGSGVALRIHDITANRARPYSNETETVEDHIVEFTAVGTAIAVIGRGHEPSDAALVLDLGR